MALPKLDEALAIHRLSLLGRAVKMWDTVLKMLWLGFWGAGMLLVGFLSTANAQVEARYLTQLQAVTPADLVAAEASFDATGNRVVFQSIRDPLNPFHQTFLHELTTGKTKRVSPGFGRSSSPMLHPDGEQVLFASTHNDRKAREKQAANTSSRFDPSFDLYIQDQLRGSLTRLTEAEGYDAECAFSPDGEWVVFASNQDVYSKPSLSEAEMAELNRDPSQFVDLYLIRADASGLRRLTTEPGYDSQPCFDPKGERIAWIRTLPGKQTSLLFSIKRDGSDLRALARNIVGAGAPHFHPSGAYLVFTAESCSGSAAPAIASGIKSGRNVYVQAADGKSPPMQVTVGAGVDSDPSFDQSGKQLVFTRQQRASLAPRIFIGQWNHPAVLQDLGSARAAIDSAPVESIPAPTVAAEPTVAPEPTAIVSPAAIVPPSASAPSVASTLPAPQPMVPTPQPKPVAPEPVVAKPIAPPPVTNTVVAAAVAAAVAPAVAAATPPTPVVAKPAVNTKPTITEADILYRMSLLSTSQGSSLSGLAAEFQGLGFQVQRDPQVPSLIAQKPTASRPSKGRLVIGVAPPDLSDEASLCSLAILFEIAESGMRLPYDLSLVVWGVSENLPVKPSPEILRVSALRQQSFLQKDLLPGNGGAKKAAATQWQTSVEQFIQSPRFDSAFTSQVVYIHLGDLAGYSDQLDLRGTRTSRDWREEVERANVPIGLKLGFESELPSRDPGLSFYAKGIPSLSLHAAGAGQVNAQDAARIARFVGILLRRLGSRSEELQVVEIPKSVAPALKAPIKHVAVALGTLPDYSGAQAKGLLLNGVIAGSPAEKSGLREGDIIVSLGGQKVGSIYDYHDALDRLRVGEATSITVLRDKIETEIPLIPEARN